VLLFVLSILLGAILGSFLSFLWDVPRRMEGMTPLVMLGIAMTYAGFGAIPALLFGVPSILFLKRRGYSRGPATAALAIGGGVVGGLLMFVTFGGFHGFGSFERLGATAGASIGFMLGLLFFSGSSAVKS
jgi:hypothetical protein